MDNGLLESVKRVFKNKNTVTIIGVIVILILLYIGYSVQINNAVKPRKVIVARETIQPRTLITADMITEIDVPSIAVSENVITNRGSIVNKYSNVNSVIPAGSMFYKETVISAKELPDAAFAKVEPGQVAYNFAVNMESTYGNSIFPGNKIDIYMKAEVRSEESNKVMVGKLLENIKVLAVKDSSGKHVFEDTSVDRTPSMLIFGLSPTNNILLKKASYLRSMGVELYPVPHSTTLKESEVAGTTEVSTQELKDYIEANSINIAVDEIDNKVDPLVPTFTETGGSRNVVTITYPSGCGSTYTCTYSKNSGKATSVKTTTQKVTFTGSGKLTATVTEKDGTAHTITTEIPLSTSINGGNSANGNNTADANSTSTNSTTGTNG